MLALFFQSISREVVTQSIGHAEKLQQKAVRREKTAMDAIEKLKQKIREVEAVKISARNG